MKQNYRETAKSICHNGYIFVIEAEHDEKDDQQYTAFVTVYSQCKEVGALWVYGKGKQKQVFPSVEAAFMGAERFLNLTS